MKQQSNRQGCLWRAACVLSLSAAASLGAAPVVYTGVAGHRAAEVEFDVAGSNLLVSLRNTSTADVLVPVDVLTAVFFDVQGTSTLGLSRTSAVLGAGSTVFFGGTDPGGVVGGEWAYVEDLNGAPHGASFGISSVGVDLFGPFDRFPGSDLQAPASPNGLEYGLTSAGDDPATGNAPVTGMNALIQNEVVFTLSGLPAGFELASITNVSFQYGTSLNEPNIPGIPEPHSLALLLAGALLLRRTVR